MSKISITIRHQKKSILAVVLMMSMLFSNFSIPEYRGEAEEAPSVIQGSGTEEDPYLITTREDLESIDTLGLDKYYKQTNDIDLGEGDKQYTTSIIQGKFSGTYNGNGYVLKNYHGSEGIFNYLTGVLLNTGVVNAAVEKQREAGAYVGILINSSISELPTIKNCYIKDSSIQTQGDGYAAVGALIGKVSSSMDISNCFADEVTIQAVATGAALSVGGLVGDSECTISNCYANVAIKAHNGDSNIMVGGITGETDSKYASIENSYATGSIQIVTGTVGTGDSSYRCVGGICGRNQNFADVSDCFAAQAKIEIIGDDINAGRVVGSFSSASCNNLYSAPMVIYKGTDEAQLQPEIITDIGADGINGATFSTFDLQTAAFKEQLSAWSEDVWEFPSGKLPVLKELNVAQEVSIPIYEPQLLIANKEISIYKGEELVLPTSVYAVIGEEQKEISGVSWKTQEGSVVTGGAISAVAGTYTLTPELPKDCGYEEDDFPYQDVLSITVKPWCIHETEDIYIQIGKELQLPDELTASTDEGTVTLKDIFWKDSAGNVVTGGALTGETGIYTLTPDLSNTKYNQDVFESLPTLTVYVVLFSGQGTETDPFLISSQEELSSIYTSNLYEACYKQTEDISLKGVTWKPFALKGVYDGNGKTISDMEGKSYLFNTMSGTIKNLTISNVSLTLTSGYAASIAWKNTGTISNVTVTGDITNTVQAGGIVYENDGLITGCSFIGNVTGNQDVGGIAGYLNGGRVEKCYVKGSVNVSSKAKATYIGGIVGRIAGESSIDQCYAEAEMTTPEQYAQTINAGGICGKAYITTGDNIKISNCVSAGTMTLSVNNKVVWAGGIVGYISSTETVSNCYSDMKIQATGTSSTEDSNSTSYSRIGGIVGRGFSGSSAGKRIQNCMACNPVLSSDSGSIGAITPIDSLITTDFALKEMKLEGTAKETVFYANEVLYTQLKSSESVIAPFKDWDSEIWEIEAGMLPTLKNVSGEQQTDVTVIGKSLSLEPTETATPEAIETPTIAPTVTPEATETPVPTSSGIPEATQIPIIPVPIIPNITETLTPDVTEMPTSVPTIAPEAPTSEPSSTPQLTETPTSEPSNTPVPSTTPEITETPAPEPSSTPVPTEEPTQEPPTTPVPTETPTQEPSTTPEITEIPEETDTPMAEPDTENTSVKAVTNLKISRKSNGSIKLTWAQSNTVKGYQIYLYNKTKKQWVLLHTITKNTTHSYLLKNLKVGKTYQFKIRAYLVVDGEKEYSSFSTKKKIVIKPDTTKLKVTVKKSTAILRWKKVDNGSGYEIFRATKKKGSYKKIKTIINKKKLRYQDKKLNSTKKYYYKVRSYKIVNGKKVYSTFSKIS